jgi:NADH-ubiquinone oxidoreductase chain 1
LAEAESELVSGFMTEHAAVIFVFFFLAEYASIVLICTLTSILFLGGYLYYNFAYIYIYISKFFNLNNYLGFVPNENMSDYSVNNPIIEGLLYSLSLGLKTCLLIFIFI